MMTTLQQKDPELYALLMAEEQRQQDGMTLIPSENHTSRAVLEALTSVLSDKYAEGYPGKRYYAGNQVADQVESLVQERAKTLFNVPFANVQPYSGSPANLAILSAVCETGEPIMGLNLLDGGHLTHGWKFSLTSKFWKSVPYHMTADGQIDLEEVEHLALEHKPKIIICGGTAIPRAIPFAKFTEIADKIGAYLLADVSHIGGLIAGGQHENPEPHVHLIMSTTHKTLRGPRGAIIMVTQKGVDKDPDLPEKINKTIIPGMQGGPHLNTIAGIGVALNEDAQSAFKDYARQIVENAKILAHELMSHGFKLVSGGTDNHLILIDLSPQGIGRGVFFHEGLERFNIYTNKNTVPGDPSSPFYPSGLRIGTPAITTRGMGPDEMKQIAKWIADFAEHIKDVQLPQNKEDRKPVLKSFRDSLTTDPFYQDLQQEVIELCRRFPIPALQNNQDPNHQ